MTDVPSPTSSITSLFFDPVLDSTPSKAAQKMPRPISLRGQNLRKGVLSQLPERSPSTLRGCDHFVMVSARLWAHRRQLFTVRQRSKPCSGYRGGSVPPPQSGRHFAQQSFLIYTVRLQFSRSEHSARGCRRRGLAAGDAPRALGSELMSFCVKVPPCWTPGSRRTVPKREDK